MKFFPINQSSSTHWMRYLLQAAEEEIPLCLKKITPTQARKLLLELDDKARETFNDLTQLTALLKSLSPDGAKAIQGAQTETFTLLTRISSLQEQVKLLTSQSYKEKLPHTPNLPTRHQNT